MNYGLQLYSVRDAMEKDVESTLAKVAEIGYKYVEFAGFFGHPAEEIKGWLDKYGLICTGTHTGYEEIFNNTDACIEYHKVIGCNTIIIPWYSFAGEAAVDDFNEKIKAIRPKLDAAGMTLGYHNHAHEFKMAEDGFVPYCWLECKTDIRLEVDTYWAFVAKTDPAKVLERLGSRLCAVHVKDGLADGSQGKPLGQGEAPVAQVVAKAKELGLLMVVESENLQPDGLTEAETCFKYLKSIE